MVTIQFDPIGKFKYTKNDCGQYHSYNDEPAIEYLDGSAKLWYKNGLIHRIDKPAIIHRNYDGGINEEYYFMGTKFADYEESGRKCVFFCDNCDIEEMDVFEHNDTHHLFVCYCCEEFIKCKPKKTESE